MKRKHFAFRLICAAVALAFAGSPHAQNQWRGVDSNWSDSGNWTGGVPVADQDVLVTDALGGVTTVDYNESGSSNYKTLLIDGVSVVHGDFGSLRVTEKMTVGFDGVATYDLKVAQQLGIGGGGQLVVGANSGSAGFIVQNHADSFVQVGSDGGDLILGQAGGAYGSYSLTAGTLQVAGYLVVGDAGEGLFTQDGGTVNAGILVLGRAEGGLGTYDLNGGTLNDQLIIGDAGVGVFNNNGALHNVTGELILGNQPTGDGTYNLNNGGIVTVSTDTIVGNQGKGTFNHVDGDHVTDRLIVGNQSGSVGSYKIDTGTLSVATDLIVGNAAGATGTFTQNGGTVVVSGDTIIGNEGSGSYYQVAGDLTTNRLFVGNTFGSTGTYTIDSGTLTVTTDLSIGYDFVNYASVGGTFTQNGGQVLNSGGFYIEGGYGNPAGTYTLNDGYIKSGNFGSMSNDAVFNHNGGQHDNLGLFIIGNGGGSDFATIYNIKGATSVANFNDLWVGGFGVGILNQSGGTVNVAGEMRIGDGPNVDPLRRFGEYNLSGGTLDASNNVIVGAGNGGFAGEPGGFGTFNQSAGTVLVGGNLDIGQGGSIGGGLGFFNMDGGSLSVTGASFVGGGGLVGGTGTFTLNDGTLTTGALVVAQVNATGTFNQSGGSVTVNGFLTVGEGAGSSGTYNLSGGTLTSGNTIIGAALLAEPSNGVGVFNQIGGSFETGFLNVGGGGFALKGTGTYQLDSGDLVVNVNMVLGNNVGGNGMFYQTGGTVQVNGTDPIFHGLFINSGSYSLSGGSLEIASNLIVADVASGSFTQTGGTLDVGGRINVGKDAGVTGTFTMYTTPGGTASAALMTVGDAGTGSVSISGGSLAVTSATAGTEQSIVLGRQAGSSGSIIMSGTGSLSAAGILLLGESGSGYVIQSDSSSVTVAGLRLGQATGSFGIYTLDGGTLDVTSFGAVAGRTRVGLAGDGTFNQNGGTHTTTALEIGGTTFAQGSGGNGVYNLNGGTLDVAGGTVFVRPGGAGSGSGTLNVAGGSLTAALIDNKDTVNYSGGAITANVSNNGTFNVSGGAPRTLTGNFANNSPTTLNVAASTPFTITGNLSQNTGGTIVANANVIVGGDYTNVGFDSGNGFDRRAGVSGSGQIQGLNASQTITATSNPGALTNTGPNAWTLDVGTVRGNGSVTTVFYQIGNDGSGASIRGAIQTTVNGGSITDGRLTGSGVTASNFGPVAAAGSTGNLAVTLTGSSGGVLTGQTVAVYSNFENVSTQVITVTGLVTTLANGLATPSPGPVDLGNFRIGGAQPSQGFRVDNTVSGVGAERLGIGTVGTTGSFSATNNLGGGFINPGGSLANAVTAQVSGGVAGANAGSLTIDYVTNGQLINGGYTSIAANQQTITLTATGYNAAAGSTAPDPIVIGNQRVGGTLEQQLTVSNTAPVSSFTEKLNAAFGANSGGATNNAGAVSLLAAAASDNTQMKVGVDTASSGAKAGTVTINYQTDGNGTSGLAAAGIGSQVIAVSGNVYQAASGAIQTPTLDFGNVQVGQSVMQNLVIRNTATGAAGFVEDLNASFGTSTDVRIIGTGTLTGILAGTNSTGANGTMTVSVNTGAAGNVNGSINVLYETSGKVNNVSNGLGTAAAGTEAYGVIGAILQGNVIDQAAPVVNGIANPGAVTVNFGNVRINTAASQTLSVLNQATGNDQGALNSSIASNGAPVTASGSFNGLLPGATNNASLQVGVDTSVAGVRSGSATISHVSDITAFGNCSPCTLNLPNQTVNASATVFQIAQPDVPANVNLGSFRLGSAPSQAITIGNTNVAPGFQEGLDASVSATSGRATAGGGPIVNLAAGGSSNAISVGIDNGAATAGINTGMVTLALASNGSTTSGLPTLGLADAVINVSGTGYRIASPTLNTPAVNVFARVGDAAAANVPVSITNTSPDVYTEGLKVDIGGTGGNAQGAGSIANLAAGGTSNGAITVGLASTAIAGLSNGTVTLALASTGAGTTGAADLPLAGQVITVNGKIYTPAVAQLNTTMIDFGVVRVGDAVAGRSVSVTNAAAVTALNDTLAATMGAVSGPFNGAGSLSGLEAGTSGSGTLAVGLDTAAAGVFNGAATVDFVSQNPDMADLALGGQQVMLLAQVNNLADALFVQQAGGGSLSRNGSEFTLDLGTLMVGDSFAAVLGLRNDAAGPADDLSGSFDLSAADDFDFQDWNPIAALVAGATVGGLQVGYTFTAEGLFEDLVLFNWASVNGFGPDLGFTSSLRILARVVQQGGEVPEPRTMALIVLAAGLAACLRRRPSRAH